MRSQSQLMLDRAGETQFSGAIRFTQAGEEASHNTDIGIITYKLGRWGSSGSVCYTIPHDRSNDVLRS